MCSCSLMHLLIAECLIPAALQVRYVTRGGRVHTLKPVRLVLAVCLRHAHCL